jgi:hypothetical protein
MVAFTNNQLDSFFTNGPQMALTNAMRTRLTQEGLTTVDDFSDFKAEQLNDAFKNMRTSIPGVAAVPAVLDNDGVVITPAIAAIPSILPILISAKCGLRLKIASIAYHYYDSIGRDHTPANMNYLQVLKDFYTEYSAVLSLSKEPKPDVPLLHKNQSPLKLIDSFKDCLFRTYGIRQTPLLYVIRDNVVVPDEVDDPLLPGKAFGSSSSILDELISRLNHDDPLFKSDNASVYSMLEESTRGTVYASTVKPYGRRKDGRSAWLSMVSSHAGQDKWEQLHQERSTFLMNTKWNGRNYSLEKFVGLHRSAFVQLQEASSHVNFQLPTEFTRVGYLINNIHNSDPDLRAAIANIRLDTNGLRINFESSVTHLLPVDPYTKHKRSSDRNANISDANALKNKSQSKTGVNLRWHKPDEYQHLTKEQRCELYEWQRSKEGKQITQKQKQKAGIKDSQSTKSKLQSKIASLEAKLKEASKEPTLEELTACIASAHKPTSAPLSPPQATPPVLPPHPHVIAAIQLKSALKRKRDEQSTKSVK